MTVPLEGKDSNIVISEMVIAGNIITRRDISVARAISLKKAVKNRVQYHGENCNTGQFIALWNTTF